MTPEVKALVNAVNRALDAYGRRGVTLKESTEREMAEFDRECPASAFPNLGARMQRLGEWTSERHARIRGDLEDAVAPFVVTQRFAEVQGVFARDLRGALRMALIEAREVIGLWLSPEARAAEATKIARIDAVLDETAATRG